MKLTSTDMLQLIAVIVVAALFGIFLKAQAPLGQNISDNSLARAVREDQSSPADENPSADLTLIVFSDYRCPACRVAHPAMKRAVERDGRVRIVYKDWPIYGAASERAAEVAIASNFQKIYPLVHDQLMTAGAGSDRALRSAVEISGGDWRRLQNDLVKNRPEILAQLGRNRRQAFELRLPGTPGYLIGPILVQGALSEAEFTRLFRQARKDS